MAENSSIDGKDKLSELLGYVRIISDSLDSAIPQNVRIEDEVALENRKREIYRMINDLYANIACLGAYYPKPVEKNEMELFESLKKNTKIYDTLREIYPTYRGKTDKEIDELASRVVGGWGLAIDHQMERMRKSGIVNSLL